MKKLFCVSGVLLAIGIMLGACSEDNSKEATTGDAQPEQEESTSDIQSEQKDESTGDVQSETEEEVVTADEDVASLEKTVTGLLEDTFAETMTVSFDEESKIYKLTPTDSEFIIELDLMIQGKKSFDDWNEMASSMASMSESVTKVLGKGYGVAVMNPVNSDKVLLLVSDGIIIYDSFKDGGFQ
ncbi:hypothetical protein CFK37_08920 [Virgibacillus phasianinus]|uniref:Uncharacterized protein n=1 Tax=Virgibacillus phasianinus TaxID=2017483 RepID=A0A220U2R4_9BACI|nr:hypothetical protein [Virgibacillus phasianinus]ASK62272.1 hypothetical protein CFK37_08920 [Virgibacillus phasianinus]